LCVALLALSVFSGSAAAQASPRAEAKAELNPKSEVAQVVVVLGSTEGSGIDPALGALEALTKPPFDSFTKKTLLAKNELELSQGKEAEVTLPNGRKLRIQLIEKTSEGRFRVSVSINRAGKQDYLPLMTVVAAPGDPFFVAGQKHERGTLIIGITIGKPR
jgi:hypothetical protein